MADVPSQPSDAPPFPRLDKGVSYGSLEVAEKVAAFTRPKLPPPVDEFTGKKTCHRFMIPAHFLTPSRRPGALNGEADLQVQMGFVTCIGVKCALWNSERLECFDVSRAKGDARVPELLEQIDGFIRLHSSEAGG